MRLRIFLALFAVLTMAQTSFAADDGIGWMATWEQAIKEARESNKPIMLVAAAPSCGGVPGVW